MIRRQMVQLVAGLVMLFVLACGNSVRGAFMMLNDAGDSSTNAKYKVDPNPAMGGSPNAMINYMAMDVTDQPGTSSARTQQGTLKITDTWAAGDCNKHEIVLMQTDTPAGGFTAGSGLRLQLEFMVANNSGKAWRSFWIKTEDMVPVNTTNVSNSHRHEAHFHPNDPNNDGAPADDPQPPSVDSMMMGFTMIDVPDNEQMAEVKGGMQPSGKSFSTKGFFMHERNLQNGTTNLTRMFKLILMPHCVPEPSSCLLIVLGWFGLAWQRRRFGVRAS